MRELRITATLGIVGAAIIIAYVCFRSAGSSASLVPVAPSFTNDKPTADRKTFGESAERRRIGDLSSPDAPAPNYNQGIVWAFQERDGSLTKQEASILDKSYSDLVTKRERLEVSIATKKQVGNNAIIVSIPKYSDQGMALYGQFVADMSAELGEKRFAEIVPPLESWILAQNDGLGIKEQSILIEQVNGALRITHSMGGLINVSSQPSLTSNVTVSEVPRSDLLKYRYLAPLIPATLGNRNE